MADRQQLQLIRQGAAEWGQWRFENHGIVPDLSYADLSGADLSGADLKKLMTFFPSESTCNSNETFPPQGQPHQKCVRRIIFGKENEFWPLHRIPCEAGTVK
jgi:hypothetical protein